MRGVRISAYGIQRPMLSFMPWAMYKLKIGLFVLYSHEIDFCNTGALLSPRTGLHQNWTVLLRIAVTTYRTPLWEKLPGF